MKTPATRTPLTYRQRIDELRAAKLAQTADKHRTIGYMDFDDWALVLPPPELRKIVETVSGSGVKIKDCLLSNYQPEPNHPSGSWFGAVAVGRNFRRLLDAHPVFVDPVSSLAGAYMVNYLSYRSIHWNPDIPYDHLKPDQERYHLAHGIGGLQHFCQDLGIGLELGWGGILGKIGTYRALNRTPDSQAFYDGLEHVVRGLQDWIGRHADAAEELSQTEQRLGLAENLAEIARINRRLVSEPPATFREACQWILWHLLAARMYDSSGSVGRLDNLLLPFYERDRAAGILDDEEAVFHLACLLVRDTGYMQIGGYDRRGRDDTNAVSWLILEAIDRLRIPANMGVAVGRGIDPKLLARGVAMQFANRNGIPKFLGVDRTAEGFAKNGYPIELGWERVYSGCHWNAIPGREYTTERHHEDPPRRGLRRRPPGHGGRRARARFGRRAVDALRAAPRPGGGHDRGRPGFPHAPHGEGVPRAGPRPPVPRHHRAGEDRGRRRGRLREPLRGRHGAGDRGRLLRGAGAARGP